MRRIKRVLITAITLCLLILMSDIPVMAAEAEKENGATRDPAPQLTQMYVYAVYSDDGGLEYINSSPSTYIVSTTNDHGGNELYVYVVEMGYAGNRTATFNGNTMTLNDMVPLDTDSNGIVDGYLIEWLYSDSNGITTGYFNATSTSVNYPYTQKNIYNFRIR